MAQRVPDDERELIARLLTAGYSIRQTAAHVRRSTRTIQNVAAERRIDCAALAAERKRRHEQLAAERAAAAGIRIQRQS